MKISGYRLREALRNKRTLRDVLATRFNDTLWQFKGSEEASPKEISERFVEADHAVASIEAAQQLYNQQVTVRIGGEKMSLSLAIKLVGGAGRHEKMWRSAAVDKGRDRYTMRETSRKLDEEQAVRMVSVDDSLDAAMKAAQHASELRSSIAEANSNEIEIDLSPDLLK